MTQGSPGFSLITVHDDEDDVVIQAGIRGPRKRDADDERVEDVRFVDEPADGDGARGEAGVGTDEADVCGDDADVGDDAAADAGDDADAPASGAVGGPARGTDPSSEGGRYVTTAADLKSAPMPVAQKATIIAGVILFAIAVAYCVFCR